jgi:hypothetical protein
MTRATTRPVYAVNEVRLSAAPLVIPEPFLPEFDRDAAEHRLRAFPLSPQNRRLIDYWLSLWDGDELPHRDRFRPNALRELLPGLAVFEIGDRPEILCRLAGSSIVVGLGIDPTGKDILALTPEPMRATRLERFRLIAQGAVGHAFNQIDTRTSQQIDVEAVMVPFRTDSLARQLVGHTTWRVPTRDSSASELAQGIALPLEFQMISLTA